MHYPKGKHPDLEFNQDGCLCIFGANLKTDVNVWNSRIWQSLKRAIIESFNLIESIDLIVRNIAIHRNRDLVSIKVFAEEQFDKKVTQIYGDKFAEAEYSFCYGCRAVIMTRQDGVEVHPSSACHIRLVQAVMES